MSRHWLNRLIVPRFVWDFWRFKMTLTGRMLLGCIFFASFGLITIQVPIFFTYSALSALLILAFLVGLLFRPRVRLDVTLPSRVSVGESVKGRVRVTNRSRWPAFDISVGFIDLTRTLKHLDHEVSTIAIGSTDSVDLPITIEAHRRGLHQLKELRAYSSFPFHLFRSGSSRTQLPPLLVVPKFYPLTDLDVPANTRHQPGGIALTSRVGESSEYIGNRDYVPGEPVRRIDFRAWARTGQPVLREYQEEYYCRVAVVLDTHVTPRKFWIGFKKWDHEWYFPHEDGPETYAELEAAISLTASIADALGREEYLIDLFAAGPELYAFRSGRNLAHFENLLEILSCVEATRENPLAKITPRIVDELGQISTVICVLLDWDESRRDLARAAQEAGCQLKRVIVRNGPTTLPLDDPEFGQCPQFTPAQVESGGIEYL